MSTVHTHTPIILASSSVVRQQMLKQVGLTFQVMPSGFDETALKAQMKDLPVIDQALALAREKALAVSRQHPESLTIGADQICALDSEVLSKPGSYENAHAHLRKLSGNTHTQNNGMVIAKGEAILFEHQSTATLTLRDLTDAEIKAYVAGDEPLHACGAYKFESLGRHLFAKVEGDHDVIKGLPLTALLNELYRLEAISLK